MLQVQASAPGKVIVHGEHAVVHGAPALAVAIDRRTYATLIIHPDQIICRFSILGRHFQIPHSDLVEFSANFTSDQVAEFVSTTFPISESEVFVGVSVIVYLFASITSRHNSSRIRENGFDLTVETDLPIGAGLGSSASFCAAISGAILHASEHVDVIDDDYRDLANTFAYEAERIVHGNPSGVDNFVVVGGGAARYVKGSLPERLSAPSQRVIVVDTCVGRSTKILVQRVQDFLQSHKGVAKSIFAAIAAISNEASDLLKSDSARISQELVNINQHLLNALGVGHPAIDRICEMARKYGLAAKLTGAGGGGCVLCIVPDNREVERFILEVTQAGFIPFETTFTSLGLDVRYI